jgi:putative sigma-54 modulation protein
VRIAPARRAGAGGSLGPTRLIPPVRADTIPERPTVRSGKDSIVQVKVTARHGHLDEAAQAEIREKAEKLLHYFERVSLIEVTIDLHGPTKSAEILLNAEHKHDFVARAEADDVATAVTAAVEKMKHQIKHYKEKIQDHRRNPSHGGPEGIRE